MKVETRVRKTSNGYIVARAYDGKCLAGPFDTIEEAASEQARGDFDSGRDERTPKRNPKTVLRTDSGGEGRKNKGTREATS